MAAQKPAKSQKPFIGVPTTTPVAFLHAGTLYLERMSVLGDDGAGILCTTLPFTGETLQLVFRLSTSAASIRCKARVEGDLPTTPAGLALKREGGDKALQSAMSGAATGDSVTMMFRMSDLEGPRKPSAPPTSSTGTPTAAPQKMTGFSVRFLDLDDAAKAAVQKHVALSRQLSESLSTRGGDRLVSLAEDDRKTLAGAFDVDNLSKKAMDW